MTQSEDAQQGWQAFFQQSIQSLHEANLLRRRVVTCHAPGQTIARDGRKLINFGGNDYLGLRFHPEIIAAATASLQNEGCGSGASPAVTGFQPVQRQLEKTLSTWTGHDDSLLFSSGFAMNIATIPALAGSGDAILSDQLNHASLIDGCRLSAAQKEVYAHNNTSAVLRFLQNQRHRFRRVLIVTESIFSMDGDAAPLSELADLCERFECGLIVDEAHATGVYGNQGAGLVDELGLHHHVLVKLGTLSKAIGCLGGFASGSQLVIEFLLNHNRSYMFSTALPASVHHAANTAIGLIQTMASERAQLRTTARDVREHLRAQGWRVTGVDSPIIPVILESELEALQLSASLAETGLFIPAIRPPTVPRGTSRLRISLSAGHSSEQIHKLIDSLASHATNK